MSTSSSAPWTFASAMSASGSSTIPAATSERVPRASSNAGLDCTPSGRPPAAVTAASNSGSVGGFETEAVAQPADHAIEVALVAAHGLHQQPPGELVAVDDGMLDREPHDGLVVAVQDRRPQHAAAHAGDRHQGTFLDHRRQPIPDRPRRNGRQGDRGPIVDVRRARRHPGLVQRQPAARRASGRPLRAQPGLAEPGIERVEQHAVGRGRATDLECHTVRQRGEDRSPVELLGQHEFKRAR